LLIDTNVKVTQVEKEAERFIIRTSKGTYESDYVIWAAGEYQYPKTNSFKGEHLCSHYSEIESFAEVMGKNSLVIGGYESGFDAAICLAQEGKNVTLIDSANYLELVNSDSSYSLSPYTRDRLKQVEDKIDYRAELIAQEVNFSNGQYLITTDDGETFISDDAPINCTGFDTSLKLVSDWFDFENDYPLLTEYDESRKTQNLFLTGPQVKHGNALFCFIYKYRQRFAIVAEEIAKRNNLPPQFIEEVLSEYKRNNFYLKDLSCCEDECIC
jgi:thioredoxin reductase